MPPLMLAPSPAELEPQRPSHNRIDPVRLAFFPARVFLALGWTRAGVEKVIDRAWWDGTVLQTFVAEHAESRLPFLDGIAASLGPRTAMLLALFVLVAEFAIAASFITARKLPVSLAAACVLNVAFVAFGAVTPSAFYLVLQLSLLLSLYLRRPTRSVAAERLVIAAGVIAALAMTPFIRTLDPHAVIEDPAIMLATLAALTAATTGILAIDAASTDTGSAERPHAMWH